MAATLADAFAAVRPDMASRLAFLEECARRASSDTEVPMRLLCAAVEPAFEDAFFAECAAAGMTLITVGHRAELARHFTHELRLDGEGGAELVACAPRAH